MPTIAHPRLPFVRPTGNQAGEDRDETSERVRSVLEHELEQIETPETAEAVLRHLEQAARGRTEEEAGTAAASRLRPPAAEIEHVAETTKTAPAPLQAAAVLERTAAQTVAPTEEAEDVLKAAQQVLAPVSPEVEPAAGRALRGRELLRLAALRHLDPLHRLDARIFLAVNHLPHPPAANTLANVVTVATNGSWIWLLAVGVAALFDVPRSRRSVPVLLSSVWGATLVVEYPIKTLFRRRRPFIDIVRALVVGKKPGSWSFPSGHTASAFATALVLSTVWQPAAPLFYSVAASIGFSRIYVGAHYPGDVLTGALFGTGIAEIVRRASLAMLRRQFPHVDW